MTAARGGRCPGLVEAPPGPVFLAASFASTPQINACQAVGQEMMQAHKMRDGGLVVAVRFGTAGLLSVSTGISSSPAHNWATNLPTGQHNVIAAVRIGGPSSSQLVAGTGLHCLLLLLWCCCAGDGWDGSRPRHRVKTADKAFYPSPQTCSHSSSGCGYTRPNFKHIPFTCDMTS
jgi:hypothetical protein